MALTVTLDQAVYEPGDPMVLTVVTAPEDRDRFIETPFTVDVSVAVLPSSSTTVSVTVYEPGRSYVCETVAPEPVGVPSPKSHE